MANKPQYWRISGLKLSLDEVSQENERLRAKAAKACGLPAHKLIELHIYKKSLDAREKGQPFFVYSVDVLCAVEPRKKMHNSQFIMHNAQCTIHNEMQTEATVGRDAHIAPQIEARDQRAECVASREEQLACAASPDMRVCLEAPASLAVVVGAGPAGLFAALRLAEAGYKPLLIEQGQPVEERVADVETFWQAGCLNENSNVQFGEGGAGTFSDGKLTFRGKDVLARQVLQTLVELGAPPEILYWHKPHLGSDKLREILPLLRSRIQQAGGRILFGTRLAGLRIKAPVALPGRRSVAALVLEGAFNGEVETSNLILAPGNGARTTFRMLDSCGVALAAKPFAVGLRIEHSQSLIDKAQYGAYAGHAALPVADYQLKYKAADGRTFYSFCMCPGGQIVNASSERGGVVTNGISLSARNSGRANSAIVGEIAPIRDFPDDPLAAIAWQQELEEAFCQPKGSEHSLPVCMVEDYLRGYGATAPTTEFAPLSYSCHPRELRCLLPEPVGEGLALALVHWQKQIPGFAEQAVLAGVESRTSCPVRILRGEDGQSVNTNGLYPAGEGAGYAGGILSSATDGLRAAEAVINKLNDE